MNYAELKKQIEILVVDEAQAGAICGKVSFFLELKAKFGIEPLVSRKSCVLYSLKHIRDAIAQQEAEVITHAVARQKREF